MNDLFFWLAFALFCLAVLLAWAAFRHEMLHAAQREFDRGYRLGRRDERHLLSLEELP
jgi:hypothetical protein